jgi:hypothetical protein
MRRSGWWRSAFGVIFLLVAAAPTDVSAGSDETGPLQPLHFPLFYPGTAYRSSLYFQPTKAVARTPEDALDLVLNQYLKSFPSTWLNHPSDRKRLSRQSVVLKGDATRSPLLLVQASGDAFKYDHAGVGACFYRVGDAWQCSGFFCGEAVTLSPWQTDDQNGAVLTWADTTGWKNVSQMAALLQIRSGVFYEALRLGFGNNEASLSWENHTLRYYAKVGHGLSPTEDPSYILCHLGYEKGVWILKDEKQWGDQQNPNKNAPWYDHGEPVYEWEGGSSVPLSALTVLRRFLGGTGYPQN